MSGECINVILPVCNEEENISPCLEGITRALADLDHEILVCYDFDEDSTLRGLDRMERRPATLRLVKNTLGRGAAYAIRAGFAAARGDVLVTTMADLSDPPDAIRAMAEKIRQEGADVVSGSRYMKGGSQTGGPRLKTLLSRAAGLSLHAFAGVGTRDATTNFRAYSRRFIDQVQVESRYGMELALELTTKAHRAGFRVDEVPSTWKDRSAGVSQFRLWRWLPRYLVWYLKALAEPLVAWTTLAVLTVAALVLGVRHASGAPFGPASGMDARVVTGQEPLTLSWLFSLHEGHRIPLPRLIWVAIGRLSGVDACWGPALSVLLLAASAALLLRALLAFRGRLLWTDALVPLLLLHEAITEALAWPFQLTMALAVLLVAIVLRSILGLKHRPPPAGALPTGLALLALPMCGVSGLPMAALLAPWWFQLLVRKDRRPLAFVLPTAALLLFFALRFPGTPSSPEGPSGSDSPRVITAALHRLAGSLGPRGEELWPASAGVTVLSLLLSFGILLRSWRTAPRLRETTGGLMLTLGGLIVLALCRGSLPTSEPAFREASGLPVTMFCLFPFILYLGADFLGAGWSAFLLRAGVFCLALALLLPTLSRVPRDGERRAREERHGRGDPVGRTPAAQASRMKRPAL